MLLTCLILGAFAFGATIVVLHHTGTPLPQDAKLASKPAQLDTSVLDPAAAKLEAERLLKQANDLANQHRYSEALIVYLNAHNTDPENAEINYRMGYCQLKLLRENQAQEAMERAIKLDPNHVDARVVLSEIYLLKTRAAHAIESLKQVEETQPDHLKALQLLVHAHAENYQLDLAASYAEKVIAHAGTNVNARVNVASFYLGQDQPDKAEAALKEIMESDAPPKEAVYTQVRIHLQRNQPTAAEALLRTLPEPEKTDFTRESLEIDLLATQGRRTEAAQGFKKLAARSDAPNDVKMSYLRWLARSDQSDAALSLAAKLANSNDPREMVEAEFLRAKIYYQKRLYSEALKHCRTVIGINPNHLAALFIKAQSHLAQHDKANAHNTLERILELKPNHLEAGLQLAMIHTTEQRWHQAQSLYEQLASAHPNNVVVPSLLGALHFKLGQYPESIRACEQALSIEPKSTMPINRLTLALVESGDLERAMNTISDPYHHQPENPALADAYAWLRVKQGKLEEAIPLLESLCARQPGSLEQFHLGMAYALDGRPQLAREQLEAALALSPDFPGAAQAKAELRRLDQTAP